ncbi:MAG: UPF0149 family protein [Pseudomonas sp.]|uniref:UPF0149 family protein n=1 Tax=Pseudomonas sp. TaxID=306 RepID=UPI003D11BE88
MHDTPLTPEELDFLDAALLDHGSDDSVLGISELDGFFTALVSGPEAIMPSTWLPELWGGVPPTFASFDEEQAVLSLLLRHMNDIASLLMTQPEHFTALFYENEHQGKPVTVIEDWCFGYMRGVDLGQWPQLPEPQASHLEAIALHGREEHFDKLDGLSLEQHQALVDGIEPAAIALHAYWLAQRNARPAKAPLHSARMPGRNEPCICGSGKKFKHCCLH